MRTFLTAITWLLALVFALPSCFTSQMWRSTMTRTVVDEQPVTPHCDAEAPNCSLVVWASVEAKDILRIVEPSLPPEAGAVRVRPAHAVDLRLELREAASKGIPYGVTLDVELFGNRYACWFSVVDARVDRDVVDIPLERHRCKLEAVLLGAEVPTPAVPGGVMLRVIRPTADGLEIAQNVLLTPFTLVFDVGALLLCPIWLPIVFALNNG